MTKARVILAIPLFFIGGCFDFKEPKAQDATQIYGCYGAPGAPSLAITSHGMVLADAGLDVPFHYEFRKVGAVLRVPLIAQRMNGKYAFQRSDDHFYRIIQSASGPTIRVAFSDGVVFDYRRQSTNECAHLADDRPQP
jgi:hypothetical protein